MRRASLILLSLLIALGVAFLTTSSGAEDRVSRVAAAPPARAGRINPPSNASASATIPRGPKLSEDTHLSESGPADFVTAPQENERLLKVVRDSGPAARDDVDALGYQLAQALLAAAQGISPTIRLDAFDCGAAACVATFSAASSEDIAAIREGLQGLRPGTYEMVGRWPGGRIYPPPIVDGARASLRLIMVRPDKRDDVVF